MPCASSPPPSSHSCISAATNSALIELLLALSRALRAFHTRASTHVPQPPRRPFVCSYCSDPMHFIRDCPHVASDICAGICQRNVNGKVVLPSGLFVPHHIVGSNLRSRITAYHRRLADTASTSPIAPASTPSPTSPFRSPSPLSPSTDKPRTVSMKSEFTAPPSSAATNDSIPNLSQPLLRPSTSPIDLDPDEIRMAELQREVAALESRRNTSASITPAPESPPPSPTTPTSSPAHTERRPDLSTPPTYRLPVTSADQIAGYAPPKMRNFGLPPPAPPRHKITKSTPTSALHFPVLPPPFSPPPSGDDPDALVTITTRELLSLSPDTRSQILAAAAVTSNIAIHPSPVSPSPSFHLRVCSINATLSSRNT
ncbi:hypothetical protein C8R44DRAFT_740090 [Mycena epipterygia]|nr:hypothetical protein C8R44DRAFT_740089 [Mycena epipterygia]KAJ7114716.1 hypothetical protein C8R44DRAFT_740090 [Mycena epipterygia]